MSPVDQQIAIAEACGWKEINHGLGRLDSSWEFKSIPHYLSDLNAMHEAEKVLTNVQHERFQSELWDIVKRGEFQNSEVWPRRYISATAAQRAEAFLRTLNLWKEDEK